MKKYTELFLIVLASVVVTSTTMNTVFAAINQGTLVAAQYGPHRYNVYENTVNGTDIMFEESHDNGMNFSDPVNLTSLIQSPQLIVTSNVPLVGAFGENVYVTWQSLFASGIKNLFYAYSEDGGTTFDNATNISLEEGDEGKSVISSVLLVNPINGTVYISYQNDDGSVTPCRVKCDSSNEHIGSE